MYPNYLHYGQHIMEPILTIHLFYFVIDSALHYNENADRIQAVTKNGNKTS